MKKYLVVCLAVLLFNFSASASHFMGGEITWKCIKSGPQIGKYVFQMKVYRDCSGQAFSQVAQTIDHHNYPAAGNVSPILMNFISATDISPIGAAASGNACFDCASQDVGAVEEFTWRSDTLVLGGSPPADGWHFTWGTCCRSSDITNGMADDSWTLRAVMLPYNDPVLGILPANPCYDSSPEFKERAKTTICSGYPFAYSHNASDEELDDITYEWAEPLGENTLYDPANPNSTALMFSAPYSINSPIPGNPVLIPETGEISYFSPNTNGVFVTCVKVAAIKCGDTVAEIYREVQVQLINCPTMPSGAVNNPPIITDPVGSTHPFSNIPNSAGLPAYELKNVKAGEFISFDIQAEDLDTYPGGVFQDITLGVSGGQFSADYTDPLLCHNPPCATFNNGGTPALTPPFSAPSLVSGVFEWQTTCDHILANTGCGNTSNIFTFVIKAFDDFCPANGIRIATIKITVEEPSPDLNCVSVQNNGDIDLTWEYLSSASPTTEPFYVWHSINISGPYTMLDSVDFPINTYTHVGANGNDASQYYFLSAKDACSLPSAPDSLNSDTLQSIFMDVMPINFGLAASLNWNPIHDPLLSIYTDYDLYLKQSTGLFINYLSTPLLTHQYDVMACNDNVQFYVEIPDASGCVSKSSIGVANLLDTITPIIPIITDVSVDTIGRSVISWIPSPGADSYIIYLHGEQGEITIDTVVGELSSSYTYLGSSASQYYETFSIRALDSCGNAKNTTPHHNSIYLEADLNACKYDITLNWNEYINWDADVSYYSVIVEETDLSGFTTVLEANLQNTTNYVIDSIKDNFSYKIYIVANDGDTILSALSNQLVLVSNLNKKPDFNYIEYASINHDNGFVEINCLVDNTATIDHYDVMRSLREVNNFVKIGEMPFTGAATTHYTDETAKTSENFYQYQIYPVDTCGIRLSAPPINMPGYLNDTSFAQTILLETVINLDYDEGMPNGVPCNSKAWVDAKKQYTNTLTFNEYDKWLGDVSKYILYRSINRQPFNLIPICTWDRVDDDEFDVDVVGGYSMKIFPGKEGLKFIDVVTEYGDGNGRFCYYIEAIEGDATPYGPVLEGSFSNVSCVSQTPIIFIPSAFTPNGDEHNEVFRPVTYYVSDEGYSFSIYSRSGEEIFTANNPLKGWDGTFNGNIAQDGNYVYHLQYINGVGDLTEKIDIITLVR